MKPDPAATQCIVISLPKDIVVPSVHDGLARLVPSEHSSGPRKRQGAITKCGNGYARRFLIEAAWAYRYTPKVSPSIQQRHQGIAQPIVDRAWDAQVRLCKRFSKLSARGKPHNIIVVAIARELCGFIWDIARIASANAA
jgi:transposase